MQQLDLCLNAVSTRGRTACMLHNGQAIHAAARIQSSATNDDKSCSLYTAIQPMQLSRPLHPHWLQQGMAGHSLERQNITCSTSHWKGRTFHGKGRTSQWKGRTFYWDASGTTASCMSSADCIGNNCIGNRLCW